MKTLSFWQIKFALYLASKSQHRRYAWRWLKSQEDDFLLKHKLPWITFGAIDYLDNLEFRGKTVFEFGSGGSTLYWLKRGAACISIEHDQAWYERLRPTLADLMQVDYRFVPPSHHPNQDYFDASDPDDFSSDEYPQKHQRYENYVKQIDHFPDHAFYAVLIDGRSRAACIKHAVPKVQPNGYLILDNAERSYYTQKTATFLNGFEQMRYAGCMPCNAQFSETRIYRKHG